MIGFAAQPKPQDPPPPDALRIITVRLPAALHESLKATAQDRRMSLNKLCVGALIAAPLRVPESTTATAPQLGAEQG